jgi:hypothetical protein
MLLGCKEERVSYVAIAFCELNKVLTQDQLVYHSISTWLWKISAPVESRTLSEGAGAEGAGAESERRRRGRVKLCVTNVRISTFYRNTFQSSASFLQV